MTKYLGGTPGAKIHHITGNFNINNIPTTEYREVEDTPEERRAVLAELGYELNDFDLWDGWLFLEEASAELLIRSFLIPTFVPRLTNRMRTISSRGAQETPNLFDEFYRLFLFTHLTPTYLNKAWVILDGDTVGKEATNKLLSTFTGVGKQWNTEHFRNFLKENFEEYYPNQFAEQARSVLALPHGQAKQDAKAALVKEVLQWAKSHEDEAKAAFQESAADVIRLLQEIEQKVLGTSKATATEKEPVEATVTA